MPELYFKKSAEIVVDALSIMPQALVSTFINCNPFTCVEAKDTPQRNHLKQAMEAECTLMMYNNSFTTISSWEARQLQVKPIRSKWIYKTKYNPDGTI